LSRQFWAVNAVLVLVFVLTSCQTTAQKLELSNDYYNIGNAYSDLEKYDQASEYYKRALQLNPDLNQAAYNLARTNLETGDIRSALKLLDDLEQQDDQNLMVLEMMGYAWYKNGDSEKASEYYKRCLEIDDAHIRSLYNLCILEKENEEWSLSGEYLERLLLLDDRQEYRVLRAELAVAQGKTESAIMYYEDLVLEYGGNAGNYGALKELYLQTEMYYKALEMLDLLIGEETDKSIRKDLYFEKSRIEIQTLDDVILGQADLISALEDGYNDKETLDELVASADSMFRADLEKIISEKMTVSAPDPDEEQSESGDDKKNMESPKSPDDEIKKILSY